MIQGNTSNMPMIKNMITHITAVSKDMVCPWVKVSGVGAGSNLNCGSLLGRHSLIRYILSQDNSRDQCQCNEEQY